MYRNTSQYFFKFEETLKKSYRFDDYNMLNKLKMCSLVSFIMLCRISKLEKVWHLLYFMNFQYQT